MLRVILFFVAVVVMAVGLSWLADRPGRMVIDWQGREFETTVFYAVVMLTLLIGLAILPENSHHVFGANGLSLHVSGCCHGKTDGRRWYDSFNEKWDLVAAHGFDERFRRMWNFYLTSCAGTFQSGNCDVTQTTISRPAD